MKTANGSEDWRVLCELASKEMDSDKLMDLVAKINLALDDHKYGKIAIETVIPCRMSSAS